MKRKEAEEEGEEEEKRRLESKQTNASPMKFFPSCCYSGTCALYRLVALSEYTFEKTMITFLTKIWLSDTLTLG